MARSLQMIYDMEENRENEIISNNQQFQQTRFDISPHENFRARTENAINNIRNNDYDLTDRNRNQSIHRTIFYRPQTRVQRSATLFAVSIRYTIYATFLC